jgi:hypothetical protein
LLQLKTKFSILAFFWPQLWISSRTPKAIIQRGEFDAKANRCFE